MNGRKGWEPVYTEMGPGYATMPPAPESQVDRLAVPGGWLYRYSVPGATVTVVFVPAPQEVTEWVRLPELGSGS